jgi:phosphotransferase system HPr (HPr) family protein
MGDEDPTGPASGPSTASAELVVEHEHGLHLRPAADFVRLAATYQSVVKVANLTRGGGREANARSLLEVTALGVNKGHAIRIQASGADADAAVLALADLIRSNFGTGG